MSRPKSKIHPLAGARFGLYWKRYFSNRPYSSDSRLARFLTGLANTFQAPLSACEQLIHVRRIECQTFEKPPIFIVGHWRSGTTHLHNLLSQDSQFGYLSLGQMAMPGMMLGIVPRLIYKLLSRNLPERRSFDRIKLGVHAPQEEEIALANLNSLSYYNCYYYPQKFHDHFQKSVLQQGTTEKEVDLFSRQYLWLLKKLSLVHQGNQLLLKNPSSTARLPLLANIIPNAKFVHIVRNPFHVFPSSLKRLTPMLRAFAWQKYDHLDLDEIVLTCYELLMKKYLLDVPHFESSNLIEIRYEDLIENPVKEIEMIYEKFQIPDSEKALKQISQYVGTIQDYQRNTHTITQSQYDQITNRWQFALDHWNYKKPNDIEIKDS